MRGMVPLDNGRELPLPLALRSAIRFGDYSDPSGHPIALSSCDCHEDDYRDHITLLGPRWVYNIPVCTTACWVSGRCAISGDGK